MERAIVGIPSRCGIGYFEAVRTLLAFFLIVAACDGDSVPASTPCVARALALAAWLRSGIGKARLPGSPNLDAGSALRVAALSFAIVISLPQSEFGSARHNTETASNRFALPLYRQYKIPLFRLLSSVSSFSCSATSNDDWPSSFGRRVAVDSVCCNPLSSPKRH